MRRHRGGGGRRRGGRPRVGAGTVDLKQELLAQASRTTSRKRSSARRPRGCSLRAPGRHGSPRALHGRAPVQSRVPAPAGRASGGERTSAETIERAAEWLTSIGMHPLRVRVEIDGFLADRLLEALWREALWLVHDGVATVEEVDDALRYGAGLRMALMGPYLTYRIAGGERGMRHFMAQFGPALQWPWTKLTDVPELTDEFLDRLTAESDAQARGRSIAELEQMRDDCLVGAAAGVEDARAGRRRDARAVGARAHASGRGQAGRGTARPAAAPLESSSVWCPAELDRLQQPCHGEPLPASSPPMPPMRCWPHLGLGRRIPRVERFLLHGRDAHMSHRSSSTPETT